MKSNLLILCIGAVAALYACKQEIPSTREIVQQTSDCKKVASRIKGLKPGFDPASYTLCDNPQDQKCTKDPDETLSAPRTDTQDPQQDIIGACNIAPIFFQAQLSKLHRIYIDTDSSPGRQLVWGLRQRKIPDPDDPSAKKKNIGISLRLWADASLDLQPGHPYASYETLLVAALLNQQLLNPQSPPLPSNAIKWLSGISYTAAPDPTPSTITVATPKSLSILAILAHEMGHIIWWENNIFNTQCIGDNFYKYTWIPNLTQTPRFHYFGQEIDSDKSIENFDKDNIVTDLNALDFTLAGQKLQAIYGNGNWADLFATVSPDEDFIETYKLYVVTQAQGESALTNLTIQPWGTDVVADHFNDPGSNLGRKRAWIDTWHKWVQSGGSTCRAGQTISR